MTKKRTHRPRDYHDPRNTFGVTDWHFRQMPGGAQGWVCPEGHVEEDYSPLPATAYCGRCGRSYSWSEVTPRGVFRNVRGDDEP